LKELRLSLVEDIFWNLYREHIENAKRMGVVLKEITRT
jgi:hypothetical protein